MRTTRISWLLLLCVVIACGKETPTAPEAVATKIEAASSVFVRGTVGSAITDLPSVIVRDQNGNPLSGVRVQFIPSVEVGILTGMDVTTDALGRATLGEWRLSTKAGLNLVTASVGLLNVKFAGTGYAAAPATLIKDGGDAQTALPRSTLATPQSVVVRDAYGNPVVNALVTFTVTGGGGSLQTTSALSDGNGVAQVSGWTLGPNGMQSLTAAVEGIAPVTFTANVAEEACSPITMSSTAPSLVDVESFGCVLSDGRRANFYSINVGTGGYEFDVRPATLSGVVTVTSTNGSPVAEEGLAPNTNVELRTFLKQGQYIVGVVESAPAQHGTYRISFHESNEEQTGCRETFLSIGAKISQVLEPGDCEPTRYGFADHYRVFLEAGAQVRVTMASDEVDNLIQISGPGGQSLTSGGYSSFEDGALGARIGFTAEKTGYYLVIATTVYFDGPYSLVVERLN